MERKQEADRQWGEITLREALRYGERYLAQRGIADAQTDAWLLLEHVTGLGRAQYLMRAQEPFAGDPAVSGQLAGMYRELLEKRGSHIPLQHLTGQQEFMGLPFCVNRHVLVPRQDTETLVEEALKRLRPGMKVLDLCTGSGCIAVSLAKLGPECAARQAAADRSGRAAGGENGCEAAADRNGRAAGDENGCEAAADRNGRATGHESGCEAAADRSGRAAGDESGCEAAADRRSGRATGHESGCEAAADRSGRAPEHAPGISVDASDISREALAVAEENVQRLNAEVRLIESDLFAGITGVYDMIVSNPPYIRTSVIGELSEEVRVHEPFLALDGREDGLHFYRRIAKECGNHLTEHAWLLLEIGYDQAAAVTELLASAGFRNIKVVRDLAGCDRVVIAESRA